MNSETEKYETGTPSKLEYFGFCLEKEVPVVMLTYFVINRHFYFENDS